MENNGDWQKHKLLVLDRLDTIDETLLRIDTKLDKTAENVVILKTKMAVYSILIALVVSVVFKLFLTD